MLKKRCSTCYLLKLVSRLGDDPGLLCFLHLVSYEILLRSMYSFFKNLVSNYSFKKGEHTFYLYHAFKLVELTLFAILAIIILLQNGESKCL